MCRLQGRYAVRTEFWKPNEFFNQNVASPIHFVFQECNEFTYQFAEEIRRLSFGAATPGYDFMARLRYECPCIARGLSPAERVAAGQG